MPTGNWIAGTVSRKGRIQGKREQGHTGLEDLENAVWDPNPAATTASGTLEKAPFLKVGFSGVGQQEKKSIPTVRRALGNVSVLRSPTDAFRAYTSRVLYGLLHSVTVLLSPDRALSSLHCLTNRQDQKAVQHVLEQLQTAESFLSYGIVQNYAHVQGVVEDLENQSHVGLCQTMREHSFVGHVKANSVLLQHRTKLMLVNMSCMSADLLYQQAITNYMSFSSIAIEDAPKVDELLMIGLESREARGELEQEDENKVCFKEWWHLAAAS